MDPQAISQAVEIEDGFSLSMTNVQTLISMLKAIHWTDRAMCTANKQGLCFSVEQAKSVQALAFLGVALFHQYQFNAETLDFCVNLDTLLQCLELYSSAGKSSTPVHLKMHMTNENKLLEIMMHYNGVVSEALLNTLETEELIQFNFRESEIPAKVIVKSEVLKEIFSELDVTSEMLTIEVNNERRCLQISTSGEGADVQFEIQSTCESVEHFECSETVAFRYRLHLVQPCVKALIISTKTSLRLNARGILSFQFMIHDEDKNVSFIEYYCAPIVEDDEADGDDSF